MTLRETKKLLVGDKFRRPSTNSHDNGWRVYRGVNLELDDPLYRKSPKASLAAFTAVDQHGYQCRVSILAWNSMAGEQKRFMKVAERCQC